MDENRHEFVAGNAVHIPLKEAADPASTTSTHIQKNGTVFAVSMYGFRFLIQTFHAGTEIS